MNKYKKFVYILISLKILLFTIIVVSNYIIDPLHFFSKKNNDKNISNLFSKCSYKLIAGTTCPPEPPVEIKIFFFTSLFFFL